MLACRAAVRRGPSSIRSSVHGRNVSFLPPGRGAGYQVPGHDCSAPTCLVCTLKVGGWPGCGPLSASVRLWTNPGATRGASVRQSASDATAVAVRFLAQCGPSRVFVVSGTFLRVLCSLVHLGPTPLVLCDLRGVLHPGGVYISALWGHGIAFKHRVAPYVSPVWLTYP